jgi:alkanesulfonate monooxygenase SsuD/methylene tetrahydromethanopterin reductase-like flavin-dependent oxidoreductase (luciferase family)
MTKHLPDDPRHAAARPRARGAGTAAGYARAGSEPAHRPQPATTRLRSALWVPPFGDLADAVVVAGLAAEAEEAGWHGVFLWDHLAWRAPVRQLADAWITLTAAATATERVRLGPMVTPLARRRPAKVARETVTLDRLSGGRLTLGVGLGSDHFGGELSATGEQLDDRRRGQMLDEALQILTAAWSGRRVHHRGEHYTVDGIQFLPRPVRQTVPVWVAGFPGKIRPLRRAAQHDGFFPVNLQHPDQLAECSATIAGLRQHTTAPYDIAIALPPGTDPAPYAKAGATWWLTEFDPEAVSLDQVRGVLRDGPAFP